MVRGKRQFRGIRGIRRKRKFTWIPVLGSTISNGESTWFDQSFRFQLFPELDSAETEQAIAVTAVVPDFTQQRSAQAGSGTSIIAGPSLRDTVEGQEWFLKRIVGKLHLTCNSGRADGSRVTTWTNCRVAAGFFVARADDDDPVNPDLFVNEINPWFMDNSSNPWIWRNTWILGDPNHPQRLSPPTSIYPSNNYVGAGMRDGPFIDAKTARRIRFEQRLWFGMSVIGYDPGGILVVTDEPDLQPSVSAVLDIRVLGAMRRRSNNSAF